MLTVINGKTNGFLGTHKIYIGRANYSIRLFQSPLANPFVIGRDGNRAQVIQKYREWLWQNVKAWKESGSENEVVKELLIIRDRVLNGENIALSCYCFPLACHGDIIVKCIHWLISIST
jgi:hypothetical protein